MKVDEYHEALRFERKSAMKLVETIIRGDIVQLFYADAPTKGEASQWIELHFRAPAEDSQELALLHAKALQHLQTAIENEYRRLGGVAEVQRRKPVLQVLPTRTSNSVC
jgi:hypothetical protein